MDLRESSVCLGIRKFPTLESPCNWCDTDLKNRCSMSTWIYGICSSFWLRAAMISGGQRGCQLNEASMERAFSVESDAYTMHWSLGLTKWQGTFVLLVRGWRISIVIGRTSSHRGSLNRGSTEGIDSFELAFFRKHQLIVKKKKQLCFETFQLYLNKNITTNIIFLFSCHDLVDADLNYLREGRGS